MAVSKNVAWQGMDTWGLIPADPAADRAPDADLARQVVKNAMDDAKPADARMARKILKHFDRHMDNLAADDVVMGDAAAGTAALKQARGLYRKVAQSSKVEESIGRAEHRAATTYSGGNLENTIRQEIGKLANSPSKAKAFKPDELSLIRETAQGTPVANFMRRLGKVSPIGTGLGYAGVAAGMQEPSMLALSAAGAIAKPIVTRMARSKANRLAEMIRAGGTLEALEGAPNAAQRFAKREKDLLVRALMSGALALEPERQR